MELVLGIDLGTSYFKLGLFDRQGQLRGLGRVAVPVQRRGDPAICELPTDSFWSVLRKGLHDALAAAKAQSSDIKAIGYSSQANSFLLLDAADAPLTPLILWPDLRAGTMDAASVALWEREDFLNSTGLGVSSAEFALVKLRWLQRNQPDLWAATRRVLTISDYLVYHLTGRAVGDEGTASLLGSWNLLGHEWWGPALECAGLDRSQLSQPLPPGSLAGKTTPRGAASLGVSPGVVVAVGSLDHYAAALGAGIGPQAEFCESTGTVLACVHATKDFRPQPNMCIGPSVWAGGFCELAFDANGASVLQWYQQTHEPDKTIADLVRLAEQAPLGSAGLLAVPCASTRTGLEGFRNRTDAHTTAHFVRAILESTAASLLKLVDVLCPQGRPARILATGGGARSDLWRQIKADLLNVELLTPACQEPACFGAATMAAAGAGWFGSLAAASAAWSKVSQVIHPDPKRHQAYRQWHERYVSCLQ